MIPHETKLKMLDKVEHFRRIGPITDNITQKKYSLYTTLSKVFVDGGQRFEIGMNIG